MKLKRQRNKKYTNDELMKLDAVDIYKLVLSEEIARFPVGFWSDVDSLDNAARCTRFLLEDYLGLDACDIPGVISKEFFAKYKLLGMLKLVCNNSPYKALDIAYRDKYKEWELSSVPSGFWTNENIKRAIVWMIEEKLNYNDEEIKANLSWRTFKKFGLEPMLVRKFNRSTFNALDMAYPGRFKPWELNCAPNRYWNKDNSIRATKWLFEEKLNVKLDELPNISSCSLFEKHGLGGMLAIAYKDSPIGAIEAAYPNQFKPWQFNCAPRDFWNESTIKESIKWLVEDILNIDTAKLKPNSVSIKDFENNGLGAMLSIHFRNNTNNAILFAYPNSYSIKKKVSVI